MERADYYRASEKDDVMFLLKTMVFLCIVCVLVTLYAEYKRMSKFEKVINGLAEQQQRMSNGARSILMRSSSFSASPLKGRSDTDDRTPTP